MADFNFRPEDPLHARMQAPFGDATPRFIDVWEHLRPGEPRAHTIGAHDRKQWPAPYACDFIFATEDLRDRLSAVRVDADTQASDHQPVLVELR